MEFPVEGEGPATVDPDPLSTIKCKWTTDLAGYHVCLDPSKSLSN